MTNPDWPALYASIQRCNAVYEPDAGKAIAAFRALGAEVLGRYCDDTGQAIASRINGRAVLTISGTRFSEGPLGARLGDLWQDIDFEPNGHGAATGAYERAKEIWTWALPLADGAIWDVEGHSLGGWATCLAPLFLPAERIGTLTAWEAPKAGTAAFWAKHAAVFERLTLIAHGADPWYRWPWVSNLTHKPGVIWLNGGSWSVVSDDQLPGVDIFAMDDHGPGSVVAAVRALAG